MGYASAVSVILLIIIYAISKGTFSILGEKE
jgi:ABC-type sugar transport system permease subunit